MIENCCSTYKKIGDYPTISDITRCIQKALNSDDRELLFDLQEDRR